MTAHQRGNLLFLLLLAVVLFAALAYAITSSMRGGGKDGGSEKADMLASQIIQYTNLIENTVMRTRMMNDIPDYGLDLARPGSNPNTTCTFTNCRVFDTTSRPGLMNYDTLPLGDGTSAGFVFYTVAVEDVGTTADDLILILDIKTEALCRAINKQLGRNVDLTIADGFGGTITSYSGTMTSFPVSGSRLSEMGNGLKGTPSGCYFHSNSTGLRFYHVILAR